MIDKNVNYIKYFLQIIKDLDESTVLNPDLNGMKTPNLKNAELKLNKFSIKEFCAKNSITDNILFLASTSLALNKFNFSNKNLIFHENNIIFTTNFENRKISIKDYLMQIKKDYNENLKYSNFSIDDLIKEYDLKSGVYYAFNKELDFDSLGYKYDFYLSVQENPEEFILSGSYNDQLYSEKYVNLFLNSINQIINQFLSINISNKTLSDIYLVEEDEYFKFNEIKTPFIHKRFEKQVEKDPDHLALVADGERLTYDELNKKANRIANALIKKGVKSKSNIVIMFHRNSNLIAAILGVLKAGCAYIPIDMAFPKERILYMYQNSEADYILAETTDIMENSIGIDELLQEENVENPNVEISPDDLAYLLYTSGSTGLPKGVMGTHRNVTSGFTEDEENIVYQAYSKMEKNLGVITVSFVAFTADFLSLTYGNTLIFANDDEVKNIESLVRLMEKEKPDAFTFTTPSRLKQYLEYEPFEKALSSINQINMGGEKVPEELVPVLLSNDEMNSYVIYGCTEVTGIGTIEKITGIDNELTIGDAPFNVVAQIRDIDGRILPPGVMGEIYIGGCGVSKGYYNLDEKSQESFITINNIPFYKTGDFGVETSEGKLISKGRMDNQIKLRGLRIEIGEIESNITKFPNVKQTAVVVKKINNNDHLCAYFTANEEIDVKELKKYLQDRLTTYMVPTVFMQLDEMPKTPNGKIFLKKLPKPVLNLELIPPETETEKKLFDIAASVAESTELGVTDDLYAVGFTSLTLMKLSAVVFEETGVNLNISKLIDEPTIRKIASEIDNAQKDSEKLEKIIETAKNSTYIPLTANQLGVYYECAQNPDEPQYNLPFIIKFDNSIDAEKLKESIINTFEVYPYLKTRIIMHGDQLMHKRDDSIPIDDIPIVEVPHISEEEIYNLNFKKFELLGGQLFRAKIYKTDDGVILFFDMHHIITDGASVNILFKSFSDVYDGKEIEKETIDGYINALIEKDNENSEEYIASERYFHELMTQEVDSTVLTPNLNGNPDDGELKSVSKNINPQLIRKFCADERISPNVLFMASTILNLNKYTFSDKTLITTIFNGRSNSNYFNTQAFLVKTLPILSINEDRNITIRQLLNQTDRLWKETLKHSEYPYTKISEEFELKPEFMYTYNNFDESILTMNGNEYEVTRLDTVETNYKITFDINESKDNLELFLLYNDQLYSEKYIKTFLNSVLSTVNQFIEMDIDQIPINEIELNKNYEIPIFTPVETPFIHKRFERQVEANPDNIALVAEDATLTAAELNEKANRIANALIKKGVKPKNNVLVMLHRNSDLIASILGILKAGCAYIPIDLEYPQDRIDYIYENSQADYIISEDDNDNSLNVKELLEETNTSNPDVEI
ncbi:non-ribosomal peptide synthetase, partial [uncultured Methanobrevibacter sp.]|uniref:non-ribosomal peptide synthetase n=1 Tax=uncultured Methanobrevibacter sp. TaxID=253161 RepID=UPI0025D11FA0